MFPERELLSRTPSRMHSPLESPRESLFRLPKGVQARLAVGAVDDPQEQEADQVAEQVVQRQAVAVGADAPPEESPVMRLIRRKCAACEGEEKAQRKTAGNLIQRTGDFEVDQLPANHENRSRRIFFEVNSTAIPASESHKIAATVTRINARPPARQNLELVGLASEEGPQANNQALAQGRAETVKTALEAAGFPGTITIRPATGEQQDRVEYAEMRSVELLDVGELSTSGNPALVDCTTKYGASFEADLTASLTAAQTQVTEAVRNLDDAITDLNSGNPPAGSTLALQGLVRKYFGSVDLATLQSIRDRLNNGTDAIFQQLDVYKNVANHQCRDACSGNTVASNSPRGGGSTAMLTVCPAMMDPSSDPNFVRLVVIHESAHGSPAVMGRDIGYRFTRMYPQISTPNALMNPDSIAQFVQETNGIAPASMGRDVPDTFSGFTGANAATETRDVETAIAFTQLYVGRVSQLIDSDYTRYRAAQRSSTRTWNIQQLRKDTYQNQFGIQVAPVRGDGDEHDSRRLAAIYDRIDRMDGSLNRFAAGTDVPLDFTRVPGAATSWAALTDSAGTAVTIGDDFIAAATPVDKLKILLRALVTATPGISAGLVPVYVEMIHDFRVLDGLPDPQLR